MKLLQEIGRVNIAPDQWLDILKRAFEVRVCPVPLPKILAASFKLSWSPDSFDRLTVARTIAGEGLLIAKDERIRANFPGALW